MKPKQMMAHESEMGCDTLLPSSSALCLCPLVAARRPSEAPIEIAVKQAALQRILNYGLLNAQTCLTMSCN